MEDARKALPRLKPKPPSMPSACARPAPTPTSCASSASSSGSAERDTALDAARKAAGQRCARPRQSSRPKPTQPPAGLRFNPRCRSCRPGCPRRSASRCRGFPLKLSDPPLQIPFFVLLACFATVFALARAGLRRAAPGSRRRVRAPKFNSAPDAPGSADSTQPAQSQPHPSEEEQEQAFCIRPWCNRWPASCI
jgi:hypothetical protein